MTITSIQICENCLRQRPTKFATLNQNIGLLIMRFSKQASGHLCKDCISELFWSFSLTTLFLGWWGIISFIITPFYLLGNTFAYLSSRGMSTHSSSGRESSDYSYPETGFYRNKQVVDVPDPLTGKSRPKADLRDSKESKQVWEKESTLDKAKKNYFDDYPES